MSDANVSIHVDTDDSELSFGGRREFGFGPVLVFLLNDEDFVTVLVVVRNACLIFSSLVGDSLMMALQCKKLPVAFRLLSENHVHAKCELAGVYGEFDGLVALIAQSQAWRRWLTSSCQSSIE